MSTESLIVIVDDDPTIARLLNHMLTRAGYKTITAVDGEDALIKIREWQPRLVFLDVMMPKKDGFQVCQDIRADTGLTQQPYVIMLTAQGTEVDEKRAEQAGVDEYLTKPFSPSKVVARVRQILAQET